MELVTDLFASRTIWYVLTDEVLLASTSQRALAALLGDFEPRAETVTWMIASGSLGPDHGWDRRLRRIPPGTALTLDRQRWELTGVSERVRYVPEELPDEEHLVRLCESIFRTCRRLDLSATPSVLTLSGGHDSRALLVAFADAGKPPDCVTWGLGASLDDPRNDAFIAARLAQRYGRSFEYFVTDRRDEPLTGVLTRFLKAGEGRGEDFGGYTDGFATWRRLFEAGLGAYVRGDAPGVGYAPAINDFVTRSINCRITLVEDYPEDHLLRRLGLAPQELDERYRRQDDESLDGYEGRLMADYYTATFQAALLDVKAAYLEPVNPLLSRSVAMAASRLPDRLLDLRTGYERMVSALVPDMPFAERPADAVADQYLEWPDLLGELLTELSSQRARQALAPAALDLLVAELERPAAIESAKLRLRGRVRALVPRRIVRFVRPAPRCRLTVRGAAWRAYIASRAHALLREDAALLAPPTRDAALS